MDRTVVIRGKNIVLQSANPEHKELLFLWSTQSDATPFWYGDLYNEPIPTRKGFDDEFPDYYFDGSQQLKGRSFMVYIDNHPVGQINYNEIDLKKKCTEFDIIIASNSNQNRGVGTETVKLFTNWLFQKFDLEKIFVHVLEANPRAIHVYEKAGYVFNRKYEEKERMCLELINLRSSYKS